MPIQKACIGFYVKRNSSSRVPTDFGVKSYARLDFIDDSNGNFEKCTYDCRTQVKVSIDIILGIIVISYPFLS